MKRILELSKNLSYLGLKKEAKELLTLLKKSEVNKDIYKGLASAFDGTKLKESSIPQKIISIPSKINSFFASSGRPDVTFKSNGMTRELKETLAGGPARDKGSLHGLGLAHDLIINTPKLSGSYNIGRNSEIIEKDPGLVILLANFADQSGLVWGGRMSRGRSFDVNGMTVHDMELHHFELPKSEFASSVNPNIIDFMKSVGMNEDYLLSSSGRQQLYSEIIKALSGEMVAQIPEKSIEPEKESQKVQPITPEPKIEESPTAPTSFDAGDLKRLINIGRLFGIT